MIHCWWKRLISIIGKSWITTDSYRNGLKLNMVFKWGEALVGNSAIDTFSSSCSESPLLKDGGGRWGSLEVVLKWKSLIRSRQSDLSLHEWIPKIQNYFMQGQSRSKLHLRKVYTCHGKLVQSGKAWIRIKPYDSDFITNVMQCALDQKDCETPEPPSKDSKPIRRIAQRQAQSPSMENDEARESSVPNPKTICQTSTCKEAVCAKEADECDGEREGCPLQEKSGSTWTWPWRIYQKLSQLYSNLSCVDMMLRSSFHLSVLIP